MIDPIESDLEQSWDPVSGRKVVSVPMCEISETPLNQKLRDLVGRVWGGQLVQTSHYFQLADGGCVAVLWSRPHSGTISVGVSEKEVSDAVGR